MTLQIKRRLMLLLHDVFVHPIIGVAKALSITTKPGIFCALHDATIPPLPDVDKEPAPE